MFPGIKNKTHFEVCQPDEIQTHICNQRIKKKKGNENESQAP